MYGITPHDVLIFAIGIAAGNIDALTGWAFDVAMRIPLFRDWVLGDPVAAKAKIRHIEDVLDADIDKAAAEQAAKAAALKAPPAPPAAPIPAAPDAPAQAAKVG